MGYHLKSITRQLTNNISKFIDLRKLSLSFHAMKGKRSDLTFDLPHAFSDTQHAEKVVLSNFSQEKTYGHKTKFSNLKHRCKIRSKSFLFKIIIQKFKCIFWNTSWTPNRVTSSCKHSHKQTQFLNLYSS